MASKKLNDRLFQLLIHILLCALSLAALVPFVLLFTSSLTDEGTLLVDGYSFLPKKWSLGAYYYVFRTNGENVFRAYGITFLVTVIGTSLSLLIGPMLAYAISRRDYRRRRVLSFLIFFTMLFNGGLVASYMMWSQLFHIKNTIAALIFPGLLLNGFGIMLMRSYFAINIHPAMIEAAKIDGAGEFRIYFSIVVPLSLPIIATIGLMVGIGYWNDWTNGLYYITNPKLFSLQNLLNRILINAKFLASISNDVNVQVDLPSVGVRMAMAVIGVIPVMVLYPFFQKFFIKGITLEGLKNDKTVVNLGIKHMDSETQRTAHGLNRMGTDSIGRLLINFSIPAIAGMVVNAIYNVVDRIYIGQGVESLAIAGIGVVMPVMLFAAALGVLIGIGANVLFSIRLGEGRTDEVEKIMGHAMALLCIMGTIGMVLTLIFMNPLLLKVMKVSENVYPYAKTYLTIIQYGVPLHCMGAGLTNLIRSDGHPKTSMLVQIAGAVTNIILDPILIFGFRMGVAGAAWATIFSQAVTWLLVIGYFNSSLTKLRFHFKKMIPSLSLSARIIVTGFPSSVLMLTMSVVGVLQNGQILKYGGDEALTAITITGSILTLVMMPIQGIGMGAQAILGYNYGAKKYDRVKKCFKLELAAGACWLTAGFLLAEIFPGFLFGLFSRDGGSLRELSIRTIRIVVMMFPVVAFQIMGGQFFQAIGKPVQGTVLSLSRQILLLIPCIFVLPLLWKALGGKPLEGVLFSIPVSDTLSSILSFALINFEFRKWKNNAAVSAVS
jgi:putative MATE family efflux protein